MQINILTMPLARFARFISSRLCMRGSYRILSAVFPIHEQTDEIVKFGFYGRIYQGKLNNYVDWMAFFYGAYEKYLLEFMRDYAKSVKDCVFIDVGANVGHHALYMSGYCSEVHAFEPLPALYAEIEEKIRLNKISNIYVHTRGLGSENVELDYYLPDDWNLGQGSFVKSQSNKAGKISLCVVNGDSYLEHQSIMRVDVLKIDVEGFEPEVLLGLSKILVENRPLIILELGDLNREKFGTISKLRELLPSGYQTLYMKPSDGVFFSFIPVQFEDSQFEVYSGNLVCLPV